ncbi:hypothetical protein Taro_026521 [Colocasia esculenta]|uniref:Uncharacterized protein n=1 Tax=Colocasia esculenta TaxID=4460 RepID=A0A843VKV2_COLES|nr:hypothetical protein [Colocasia esculenta]
MRLLKSCSFFDVGFVSVVQNITWKKTETFGTSQSPPDDEVPGPPRLHSTVFSSSFEIKGETSQGRQE